MAALGRVYYCSTVRCPSGWSASGIRVVTLRTRHHAPLNDALQLYQLLSLSGLQTGKKRIYVSKKGRDYLPYTAPRPHEAALPGCWGTGRGRSAMKDGVISMMLYTKRAQHDHIFAPLQAFFACTYWLLLRYPYTGPEGDGSAQNQ